MAQVGRRLSDVEIEAYSHIAPSLTRRVRVIRIPAIPGGFSAITLGTWILVTELVPSDGSSTLMAHELVHVRQWREAGRRRFLRLYLTSFVRELRAERAWKPAYWLIEAEREARAEETQWREGRSTGGDQYS